MGKRQGKRPLRFRGARGEPKYDPSLGGTAAVTTVGVLLTWLAIGFLIQPDSNNLPGTVIVDAVLVTVALLVDWRAIRGWLYISRHGYRDGL